MMERSKSTEKEKKDERTNKHNEDKEYIIRRLPELLKEDEEFRNKIVSVLIEFFPSKAEMLTILDEIRKLREDSNKRFEEVNRRFEEIWEEIKKHREETNKRFEEVNKRFEEVNKRFDRVDRKLDALGSRWGIMAEDTFREGMRSVLSGLGFTVIKWRKRDEKGEVFLKARDVEIDIVVKDERRIAIEIKSSLNTWEVDAFERALRFYERVEGLKFDRKVIIAVYATDEAKEYAKSLGIDVVSEPEELVEYKSCYNK